MGILKSNMAIGAMRFMERMGVDTPAFALKNLNPEAMGMATRRLARASNIGMGMGAAYGAYGGYQTSGTFGGTMWGAFKGSQIVGGMGLGLGAGYHAARMGGMGSPSSLFRNLRSMAALRPGL